MNKKLSQKERNEFVTKGYLEDSLESKNYITKDYLDSKNYITKDYLDSKNYITKDYLDSKNYVTQDWALDMFEMFQKRIKQDFVEQTEIIKLENRQHLETIMERFEEKFQIFTEKVDAKIEGIQRYVKMV